MDGIPTETTCPLGSKCQEVRDGKLYACAWYTKLVGKDPQSEKEHDEWGCAMAWVPILLAENIRMTNTVGAGVESFRNEMVKDNGLFVALAAQKLIPIGEIPHAVDPNK